MHLVRILRGVAAHQREIDRARLLVDRVHAPHDPRAFGDGALDLARRDIDEHDVVPAAALGHPEQFARLVEPVHPDLVRVVDEGRERFLGDRARGAGREIHRDEPHDPVPALVGEKRDLLATRQHAHAVDRPRVREERVVERDLAHRGARGAASVAREAEEPGRWLVDRVARLQIVERTQLRLQLVARRALDEVHGAALTFLHFQREDSVLLQRDPVRAVGVARNAVGGAEDLRALARDDEVRPVVLDAQHRRQEGALHLDERGIGVLRLLLPVERVDRFGLRRRACAARTRRAAERKRERLLESIERDAHGCARALALDLHFAHGQAVGRTRATGLRKRIGR